MKKFLIGTAAMAFALSIPGAALAATDGTPGVTSTGSFNASIIITPDTSNHVQITGLNDIVLGTISVLATNDTVVTDDICIVDNSPGSTGSVTMTVNQAGVAGTDFRLTDTTNGHFVIATLALFATGTGGTLTKGSPFATFGTSAATCAANPSFTQFILTVPGPNGDATKTGNLSGTFTVLIASN